MFARTGTNAHLLTLTSTRLHKTTLAVRAFDLSTFSWVRVMDAWQVVQAKMGDGFYRKQGSMRNNTMTF